MARRGDQDRIRRCAADGWRWNSSCRREATGMSREEVARQLEWSTSTLFRIETGRSRPQPGNVRTLLELYGVTGAERDGLIQLTREARQPGWWHSFRDVLPNPYEVYIGLEADPDASRSGRVPGMPCASLPR
jgi:transcriptional regulator with XRE-family HTH domain